MTKSRFLSRRRFLQMLGLGAVSSAALGSYAFAIEPLWRLNVTRYTIKPTGWTPGLKLRVALIADIHACNPWMSADRIARVVERTNSLQPDVTLLLGDFSAGISSRFVTSYVHSNEWAPILAGLRAPLGRYAILGNHDWWEDRTAQLRGHGPTFGQTALENVGVSVLENDAIRLEHNGHPFWIAGLGDQIALLPRSEFGRNRWQGVDDLPATLKAVSDEAPMILMAHEPDFFAQVRSAERNVALTVSGHTHGGQFRMFGYSPVVPSRFGNRYAYGQVVENRSDGTPAHLVISGGLGCSIAPLRFGVPPEIVLLELG
jgi:hypothetical protein